ncbi:MAG TPA: outer membrane lipoprotein carrier protein LolA [Silvibacterium sp.]|nr:outer membrane lipoprotein carrier protein LolA [Silvibacterium sp.]
MAQSPLTANALADRIDRHYNSLRSLEVRFAQQYDGMGMNRKETGVLLLKKPGKMRWTYSQPAGKLFILDGSDGYFYSPGDTEVQRVPVKKLDDMRSPLRLLLGHTKLAQELTALTIAPQADGTYVLTGIPKGMEKRVAAFSVTATPEGIIQSIRVEEIDGITNTFQFIGETPNVAAPDASFVFIAPAGVNVVNGMPPV